MFERRVIAWDRQCGVVSGSGEGGFKTEGWLKRTSLYPAWQISRCFCWLFYVRLAKKLCRVSSQVNLLISGIVSIGLNIE